jgi:hypothetical protein
VARASAVKAARDTPQGRLAQAVFALPHVTRDFEVLGKRGAQLLAAQVLLCSPISLVEAVLQLKDDVARSRGSSAAVRLAHEEILRRIRAITRNHALPCLRRTDWKATETPITLALSILSFLLTISAADIHHECLRVLVKGEAISQMFHEQLSDGYKIMLSQVGLCVDCSQPICVTHALSAPQCRCLISLHAS